MKKRSLNMEHGAAFHEAGHAAACFQLGKKFAYVTITPEGDSDGHLKYLRRRPICFAKLRQVPYQRFPAWIDRHLMISMAGLIAQKKGAPRSVRSEHPVGDWMQMDEFFSATNCAGPQEYLEYCRARLKCMFNMPLIWAGVEALADSLIRQRRLTYFECEEVFFSAEDPGWLQLRRDL